MRCPTGRESMNDGRTASEKQLGPPLSDISRVTGPESAILDELAELLANHKLVPFFGAGISRQQLGFAAAELAKEIAPLVRKSSEALLSQLADDFVDQYGEVEFIKFLRAKLVLSEVDDTKVSAHLLLLSLSLNLLYTTNQDNIFELVANIMAANTNASSRWII